jgi:hypothetical protein
MERWASTDGLTRPPFSLETNLHALQSAVGMEPFAELSDPETRQRRALLVLLEVIERLVDVERRRSTGHRPIRALSSRGIPRRSTAIRPSRRCATDPLRHGDAARRPHDPERPVATGHAERIRPVGHGFIDEGCQVVLRTEDEGLVPSLACRSTSPACAALPPPDRGLTNRTGRWGGSSARQPYRDRRRMTR